MGNIEIELVLSDALANAAGLDRTNDNGLFDRPSVNASSASVSRFRARLVTFLREMPEDASVRELLEALQP